MTQERKDELYDQMIAWICEHIYVCCSRPRKRLAILITVPISDQFRNYLNRVFGTQNVIEYTRFIKW